MPFGIHAVFMTRLTMNNGSVETEQAKNKIASDFERNGIASKFERNGIAKDKYKWDESAVQRG